MSGSFSLLGKPMVDALRSLGYTNPTPIQEKAIPLVMSGRNVLIVAPTGSGKTEAAMLPILAKLAGSRKSSIKAVYITPLRSLNRDIFARIVEIGRKVGVSVELRHGDSSSSEKRRFLRDPPHVMITTPESFYFLLSVETFRKLIRELKYIIVDEVHEIFSSKRGAELSLAIERVDRYYTIQRLQLIGLSATLADPYLFARRFFSWRSYTVVEDPSRKKIAVHVDGTEEPEEIYYTISSYIEKTRGKVIVFANTRDTAEILGAKLKEILGEDNVGVHHGSLSKEIRLQVEKNFKKGIIKTVVATSSLELGIDIGDIDFVIQYMSPRQVVKLLQRIGRAGHGYGATAHGVIISMPNVFDILESAVIAARAIRGNLETQPLYPAPIDALIHQITGLVIERNKVSLEEVYELISRSYFYADIDAELLTSIIGLMENMNIIRYKDGILLPGRRARSYYFGTTMIPDTKQYNVIDIGASRHIGILDEEFVATLENGDIFVLSGNTWEVVDIDDNAVRVKNSGMEKLLPPAWEGDLIPVEYPVAREVGSILRRLRRGCDVLDQYPISYGMRQHICGVISRMGGNIPGDDIVLIEHHNDTIVMYTFLGSRGNMAFEYLLAAIVEEITGHIPETTSTPYIVAIRFGTNYSIKILENIINILRQIDEQEIEKLVEKAVKRGRVFRWALLHVAIRSGAISKEAKLSEVKRLIHALTDTVLGLEAMKEIKVKKIDIDVLKNFIKDIRTGRRRILIKHKEGFSKLTLEAIGESRFPERIRTETIPPTILGEIIKRKIQSKNVTLLCMNCGNVMKSTIGRLPERPKCDKCGSGLLTIVYGDEEAGKLKNLVLKVKSGKKISRNERKVLKRYMEVADLVLGYGKKAIEALSYTGVGPQTARNILRNLVFGEHRFYTSLVEAEARYHRYKHKLKSRKTP